MLSDTALLGVSDQPGQLPGYGPVPAGWVRDLIRHADPTGQASAAGNDRIEGARVWLGRLYATPDTSTLVAMESTRQVFPAGLRRFLITRHNTCRTPWCDAPIRHADLPYWLAALTSGGPVGDHTAGGPTSVTNGQGLCERCNHTKQLPGFDVSVVDDRAGPHTVRWSTPTGAMYDSTAPPLLPAATPRVEGYPPGTSLIEIHLRHQHAA